MKKWGRIIISILLLGSILCSSSVWAIKDTDGLANDPYAEFHEEIDQIVKEILISGFIKEQSVYQEIGSIMTKENNFTTNKEDDLLKLEKGLRSIRKSQYTELEKALIPYGAVPIQNKDESTIQLASIPGDWQTESYIFYWPETKEFSYWAWFYSSTPILDMWGDYDLLSMEMKNENGWYWNNIKASAMFNDKNMNSDNFFEVGAADKHGIISGNRVSARADFWNGCIFNIQDQTIQGMMFLNGLSWMLMQGWLQTRGSSRANYVKADFEHNYKRHIFDAVAVSGSSITDFNLSVSYSNQGGSWFRTTGSRLVEIPAGY